MFKDKYLIGNLILGYYAVLKGNDPFMDNNKIGELISRPIRTPDSHKCVVFYFVMNGRSISYLRFYIRVNNKFYKVWERNGHQGNFWQKGAISLPKSDVTYHVRLFRIYLVLIVSPLT